MDNLLYSLENRIYLNSLVEKKNIALISTLDSEYNRKIKYLLINDQYVKVHVWSSENPYRNKH